jgi:hypothetical protein
MVNIVFGASDLDMDLEGFTVAEVQHSCRDILNVSMDCDAYLNGHLVVDKDAVVLKDGDRLEFMQQKGQKGVGKVWHGDNELMKYFGIDENTLQQWRQDGLPHISVQNGERRYIEDTLDPWFAKNTQPNADGLFVENTRMPPGLTKDKADLQGRAVVVSGSMLCVSCHLPFLPTL